MTTIYTKEEAEHINSNIEKLIDTANDKALQTLEPTLDERKKVAEIIAEFIKKKKRIVYGGRAIDMLVRTKGDKIYDDNAINDIEFYSYKPIEDLIELCNLLDKKGFKGVMGEEAQHEETYVVSVNTENYCDISYMPRNIYQKIPIMKVNGFHIADPEFLIIDMYRVFNDPLGSYERLSKVFARCYKLQKAFPLEGKSKLTLRKSTPETLKVLKSIFNMTVNNEHTLLIGYDAYNYYINNGVYSLDENVPFLDIVSYKQKDTAIKIVQELKKEHGEGNVKVEEYYPFFQFYSKKVSIYVNNELVVNIYGNNGKCIPVRKVPLASNNWIQVGSFSFTLMMLMIVKIRAYVEKGLEKNDVAEEYKFMIKQMIKKRTEYLKENKKSPLDDTIFREFSVDCIGQEISRKKAYKDRLTKRKEKKQLLKYRYTPGSSDENFEWVFANTSGNLINNPKNLLLK